MQVDTFSAPKGLEGAVALKAAHSALVQRQRGSRDSARALYYRAHSLLRALRAHLVGGGPIDFRPAA